MTGSGPRAELLGRRDECQALDDLLAGARAGRSAAVVVRGEPGIGKSALLKYVRERADGCRVVRASGVQSEMELSHAGLHQLCVPLLAGLDQLPEPQRDALGTAFGLNRGAAPNRFLVGLATLSLLADAAGPQPLVCLVDDAHWLDRVSAQTLEFVARRLQAESVLLVFAVREPSPGETFGGLADLRLPGLTEHDSRRLLASVVTGPLDDKVRDRIVAETRGNPLALLEFPRGLSAAELAGFGRSGARPLPSRIEQEFLRRVQALPAEPRRLLTAAAAEPVGDLALLRRTADRLGIDIEAAVSHAEVSAMLTLGVTVRFRHPLVRSAAYRAARQEDLREIHQALADETDAEADPDRRAWHLARATAGPDEVVAAELVRSADRARGRGGAAAAAAFLERAVTLTPDPARRAERAVDAAQANLHAGAFEQAAAVLATADSAPIDGFTRARVDVLLAQIAFAHNRGVEAPGLLLSAANRLEQHDVRLARDTYLDATAAAIFAGRLAVGPGLREVGRHARAAASSPSPRLPDRLLDVIAVRLTDGYAAAAPAMRRVLESCCADEVTAHDVLRWSWLASVIAADLWDDERWQALVTRQTRIARESGALSELPDALDSGVHMRLVRGELRAAASLLEEISTVCAATGSTPARTGPLGLAVWSGREQEARALIDALMSDAVPSGQGAVVTVTQWYAAVLCNSLGNYADALTAARSASAHQEEFASPRWGLAELVEAAARGGSPEQAAAALEPLSAAARGSGTNWALGVEARSRALLAEGTAAADLFHEAVERLSRTSVRMELARAHLLFGEWLRREGRRVDARSQLGIAHEMFGEMGATVFAERARRELQATGVTVRKRAATPANHALTPQETQIARHAANGLTNAEIGTRLFISSHTVEWHLRKVFSKLGIASRKEIRDILPEDAATSA
ncbi:ATP-binding protein [Lentzea sp. JNUCC 0626]|uniref:ATP-binding protein n=1 Tax=Lentzea sp. JNUCC 0626 TaxID=3367513 RepID=UPI003749F0FD